MSPDDRLTPNELIKEFRKQDIDVGKKALHDFETLDNQYKSTFLDPIIQFLSKEEEDTVHSWGASALKLIGGNKSFNFLVGMLKKKVPQEIKRDNRFTRFFALNAVAHIAITDDEIEELKTLVKQIWQDKEEDYLVQAEASVIIVRLDINESNAARDKIIAMLQDKKEFWPSWAALHALRYFPIPDLRGDIIQVMNADKRYIEHRRDAILALTNFEDDSNVERALGSVAVSNENSYLRFEAIKALSKIGGTDAAHDLIKVLNDENAENRVQASAALKQILKKEEALVRIVEHAIREGIKEEPITYYVDALRRIDPDRTFCTEILNKELIVEDQKRVQVAEKILLELGGWAAVQKFSQRRKTIESLDKILDESEEDLTETFEDTIKQARRNFYFAMGVNIIIVGFGVILFIVAIFHLIQSPEKFETWILPGSGGVIGIILSQFLNNPRQNAREDLTTLMNVNVIYLGYLRQIHQIDATFKYEYFESRNFGTTQMNETVEKINSTVTQTLKIAARYLSILKESKGTKNGKVSPLIEALEDEDKNVKKSIAEALGGEGNSRGMETLIALSKDDDKEVRDSAIKAIEKIQHS